MTCFARHAQEGAGIDTLRILRACRLRQEELEMLPCVVTVLSSHCRLVGWNRQDATFSVTRTSHLRSTFASDDNRSQFEDDDFSWDAHWDTDHSSIANDRYNHDSNDCCQLLPSSTASIRPRSFDCHACCHRENTLLLYCLIHTGSVPIQAMGDTENTGAPRNYSPW